jgi:hypothetical protein
MQKPYKNICYRCGKERTVSKVWKEKIGNSIVENTETVCPDKKCQEATEKEIRKQKNKRLQMEKRKKESSRNRKKHRLG